MTAADRTFRALDELQAAAREVLEHGPCSDPDCCSTAKANAAARARLELALAALK